MAEENKNNYDSNLELVKLAQSGDKAAREKLVEANLPLVWSVARRFMGRGIELDDLFQIGSIGLIKSVDKFDLTFGVKFSTYAVPMIMGEIRRFLRDDGLVKVSRSMKESAARARRAHAEMTRKNGKPPTIDELAAEIKTDVGELVIALESGFAAESIYKTICQNDGAPLYLIDKMNFSGEDAQTDAIALKEAMSRLSPKQREVITLRYFKDKTQNQVAEAIGVSQVQVSRIEKKALSFMRGAL
jgi:RNA polymerase sporulation-specific sigma factor